MSICKKCKSKYVKKHFLERYCNKCKIKNRAKKYEDFIYNYYIFISEYIYEKEYLLRVDNDLWLNHKLSFGYINGTDISEQHRDDKRLLGTTIQATTKFLEFEYNKYDEKPDFDFTGFNKLQIKELKSMFKNNLIKEI